MTLEACVHCAAAIYADGMPADHTRDCPFVTGLWPVEADMLDVGARCTSCGEPFTPDGRYVRARPTLDQLARLPLLTIPEDDAVVILCLGCGVSEPAREDPR